MYLPVAFLLDATGVTITPLLFHSQENLRCTTIHMPAAAPGSSLLRRP